MPIYVLDFQYPQDYDEWKKTPDITASGHILTSFISDSIHPPIHIPLMALWVDQVMNTIGWRQGISFVRVWEVEELSTAMLVGYFDVGAKHGRHRTEEGIERLFPGIKKFWSNDSNGWNKWSHGFTLINQEEN